MSVGDKDNPKREALVKGFVWGITHDLTPEAHRGIQDLTRSLEGEFWMWAAKEGDLAGLTLEEVACEYDDQMDKRLRVLKEKEEVIR